MAVAEHVFAQIAAEVDQFRSVAEFERRGPKVILAGGSGFLGTALAQHLSASGYEVVILSRGLPGATTHARTVHWDGCTLGAWTEELEGATAIINLAGRAVNCRHTAAHRREIVQSRINAVRVIDAALQRAIAPPTIWLQQSSLAIYGDPGERICAEDAPHGTGFCVDVCHSWEGMLASVQSQVRLVTMRCGFVLGEGGAALKFPLMLARAGFGGALGSGKQYVSWIQLEDYCRAVAWLLANDDARGVYNLTSPNPVPNVEYHATLRKVLGKPWFPRIPAPIVRLGAPLLGTQDYLALHGRRCIPARLLAEGFAFKWPDVEDALRVSLHPAPQAALVPQPA